MQSPNTPPPPSSPLPPIDIREVVIDKVVAEKDAEMVIQRDVAQTSKNDDDNGDIVKKDGTGHHTTNDANNKASIDTVNDELTLNLRKLLSFTNKRGSVDTSTTVGTGSAVSSRRSTAFQTGRRFSVDADSHDHQQDNDEREHDGLLPHSTTMRAQRQQRSTSLRSLGNAVDFSANLRDHHLDAGRSASMSSLGRQPSLRRRHSLCYSLPSSSATADNSLSYMHDNTSTAGDATDAAPRRIDRRATISCADARGVSLSSIITECHPLTMGFVSDDDESSSDDDSSIGRENI